MIVQALARAYFDSITVVLAKPYRSRERQSLVSDKLLMFLDGGNAATFYGYVDNLRVYNRAMTPAEIQGYALPRLEVARITDQILFQWPSYFTGYSVQSTDALQSIANWKTETITPVAIGDDFLAITTIRKSSTTFFHLTR